MARHRTEYPLVDDADALGEIIERIDAADVLAIDTEFVRERTYFAELCVVQVATPSFIAAVDCLASIDVAGFVETLLESEAWLLHSARQDLEVLYYLAGRLPDRLLDTQVAAGLVGLPAQIGLKDLLSETVGVSIAKQHTRANWARRPLPDALHDYALEDVRHLADVHDELMDRLETLGRVAWFEEDCARQLAQPIEPGLDALVERTKGAGALTGKRRSAVYALVDWRERRARHLDRPRRWVLADDPLVGIAAALPASLDELARVPGLPRRLVARSGEDILTSLEGAEPVAERREDERPDKAVVRELQDKVRDLAASLGIQPELIATRRDIVVAAAGGTPDALARGWRRELLEPALSEL